MIVNFRRFSNFSRFELAMITLKKIFLLFASFNFLLGTISLAQELKFAVSDGMDLSTQKGIARFGEVVNSLNQIKDLEFVIFSNISAELKFIDDEIPALLRKINHPAYFSPSNENFWHEFAAREKFYNTFGESNFLRDLDSVKVLGLNSAVSWSNEPFFEREAFNFAQDKKLRSNKPIILSLNDSPVEIKNFDDIVPVLDSARINFIVAPLISNKLIYEDEIILVNSKNNERKNEAYKVIEMSGDNVKIITFKSAGTKVNTASKNFRSKPFDPSKSKPEFDPDKRKQWTYDMGYSLYSNLVVDNDRIYAADVSGQVVCLNSRGKKLWDYYSFGYIYSTPTVRDNYLAIATIQGDLETIDAKTGKALQSLGFDSPITSDLTSFDFAGPVNLMIPKKTRSKAAVIIGTQKGEVFCYDLETLQEHWRFNEAGGEISGKPLVTKDHIIFYSLDGYLYSVSASTGLLTWKVKLTDKNENVVYASDPHANDDNVFITLSNGKIFSFDILLGKKNWEYSKYSLTTSLNVSEDGRLIYSTGSKDKFHVLSAQVGNWVREVNTTLGNLQGESDITELNNEIFFGINTGYFISIDSDYRFEKVFRQSVSQLFSISQLDEDELVIASHDGLITLIKIGEE